jgi:hypothetical protein
MSTSKVVQIFIFTKLLELSVRSYVKRQNTEIRVTGALKYNLNVSAAGPQTAVTALFLTTTTP